MWGNNNDTKELFRISIAMIMLQLHNNKIKALKQNKVWVLQWAATVSEVTCDGGDGGTHYTCGWDGRSHKLWFPALCATAENFVIAGFVIGFGFLSTFLLQ